MSREHPGVVHRSHESRIRHRDLERNGLSGDVIFSLGISCDRGDHSVLTNSGAYIAHSTTAEWFSAEIFKNSSGESLPYRLLLPKYDDNTRLPLVLFLHGLAESGTDNRKQLEVCVGAFVRAQSEFPSFVLVPQCPIKEKGEPWGWTDVHPRELLENRRPTMKIGKHLRLTLELVTLLQKQFPIDRTRLYALGISMGGFGTWELIGQRPGLFAAAVPICGGGDPGFAKSLAKTPVWAFHGGNDEIVPPEFSRRTVNAIRKQGGIPRYTEFPTIGHNCWDAAFATSEVIPWMFSHKL